MTLRHPPAMMARRARVLILWLAASRSAAFVVRVPTTSPICRVLAGQSHAVQQLLVDQLRDGPATRLILIAVEQGDAAARARVSAAMVEVLRKDSSSPASTTARRWPAKEIGNFCFSTAIC